MATVRRIIGFLIAEVCWVALPVLLGIALASQMGLGFDGYYTILCLELIALDILLIYWLKKQGLTAIFDKKGWHWSYLGYLLLAFLILQLNARLREHFSAIVATSKSHIEPLMASLYAGERTVISLVLPLLMGVIVGPIFEEVFYRGYLMNTVFPKSRYGLDILLSSLLFALGHSILVQLDWLSLLVYFIAGLCFSVIYRFTGNIRLVIFIHACYNLPILIQPLWIVVYNYIYYNFFR